MQLTSRNTNTLSPMVYDLMRERGVEDESRNGPVLKYPEPVLFEITHALERVNFCSHRDANPFFHLIEACAMLAGVNDIRFLSHFASNMLNYSDDGQTQNAFYGSRLLNKWHNQLGVIIDHLMRDPRSRQEVALIWDPYDLYKQTKDKACNLLLMFAINSNNELEMTSVNRSNDAIWGFCSGTNMVHLSFFHEYVALAIGRVMGRWWHFTNNLHVYVDNPKWQKVSNNRSIDLYQTQKFRLIPLFDDPEQRPMLDRQLVEAVTMMQEIYAKHSSLICPSNFLPFVCDAVAVFNAWQMYKDKRTYQEILRHLNLHVRADDWRFACSEWMRRRLVK